MTTDLSLMSGFLSQVGTIDKCTKQIKGFTITGGADENIPIAKYIYHGNYQLIGIT